MTDGQEPTTPNTPTNGQAPDAGKTPEPTGTMVDLNAVSTDGKRLYFEASYVTELRNEAAEWRQKYQQAAQQPAAPPPPAQEPAKEPPQDETPNEALKRVQALEAQLVERDITTAILEAAAKPHGERGRFIDPSDAVRLVDRSLIKRGEDGMVSGVEDALKALAEKKGHLIDRGQRQAPNTGASNPAGSSRPSAVDRVRARYGAGGGINPFAGGGVVLPPDVED